MRLKIHANLAYEFAGPCEVLLLIEAARSGDQRVIADSLFLSSGADVSRLDDPHTGERRAVFTADGRVDIDYLAEVEVLERPTQLAGVAADRVRDLPGEALRYLRPSRYCPSDRFEGFVRREFGNWQGGDKVLSILNWLQTNVEYCAGISRYETTAQDTFVDRAGVCRDFANLAVTFCRAADIPARMVSAHAWKLDPPDLHAVAEVHIGGRWRLIDPTGLAPVETLVRVATGQDAGEVAFMTIFGAAQCIAQTFEVEAASVEQAA